MAAGAENDLRRVRAEIQAECDSRRTAGDHDALLTVGWQRHALLEVLNLPRHLVALAGQCVNLGFADDDAGGQLLASRRGVEQLPLQVVALALPFRGGAQLRRVKIGELLP